jgi:hypothetical protein
MAVEQESSADGSGEAAASVDAAPAADSSATDAAAAASSMPADEGDGGDDDGGAASVAEADPQVLAQLKELDTKRAAIDAQVRYLRSGANLLDYAQSLGMSVSTAGGPAPALRGAAAASAAAKAARLAAQGIVAPPPRAFA